MLKFFSICLLLLFSLPSKTEVSNQCERLKLSVERVGDKVTAISVTGGVEPVYFIFFYPNGQLVDRNRDIKSSDIKDFSKGKFVCAVTDESGCSKKIEFVIE